MATMYHMDPSSRKDTWESELLFQTVAFFLFLWSLHLAWGSQFFSQKSNQCSLHWKHRIFFFNLFIHLIFGYAVSSLLCVDFLQLWPVGASVCVVCGLLIVVVYTCCGAQALGMWASLVAARRLSSYSLCALSVHAQQLWLAASVALQHV